MVPWSTPTRHAGAILALSYEQPSPRGEIFPCNPGRSGGACGTRAGWVPPCAPHPQEGDDDRRVTAARTTHEGHPPAQPAPRSRPCRGRHDGWSPPVGPWGEKEARCPSIASCLLTRAAPASRPTSEPRSRPIILLWRCRKSGGRSATGPGCPARTPRAASMSAGVRRRGRTTSPGRVSPQCSSRRRPQAG
jgi:hypothetical protein